ncbi:aconitate hydratase AcnA [Kitasatospora sp. NPDC058190]|uniref:aconitate hydratase AcnA n=1 Tax=Kitasatospora sp. NPDC058190 TaxID=3346371 RepID=UPI0036DF6C9C
MTGTTLPHRRLTTPQGTVEFPSLPDLAARLGVDLAALPFTIRVLLENLARLVAAGQADPARLHDLARWDPSADRQGEFPYLPSRVVLQDFTGVPAIADLAAMRDAVAGLGLDPSIVDTQVRADQVIDHSLQVDVFGRSDAAAVNVAREYQRNAERYGFLRWAQQAFDGLRVVPPGAGIVHQLNLERLAEVVTVNRGGAGPAQAVLDTVVGTDSHTTMINGLGVLGWGVGGIEAEAVMLGQPIHVVTPRVVGVRLTNRLAAGVTATDLVLTVTELLRRHGVVGAFVEYFGEGAERLGLADRATLANMAPEYGATTGFFPVDQETLHYLAATGRSAEQVELVERYCRAQGLFREPGGPAPRYSELVELDLATVEPSLAGPKRPQDRVRLAEVPRSFTAAYPQAASSALESGSSASGPASSASGPIGDGDVVIAAITSCTNTSNPGVMLAAGLLAKKAVERGLAVPDRVKTSLAPGSRVVTAYLERAGLLPYLEKLGFAVVGYGCTTCHGMSGPLVPAVAEAMAERELVGVAVLSGNRNFQGRVHPQVRAGYLASPPLVVAYALAGSVTADLTTEPIGHDEDGRPVTLSDIWPSPEEIAGALDQAMRAELYEAEYAGVFEGDEHWKAIDAPAGVLYEWDDESTYIRRPPHLDGLTAEPAPPADIRAARALAILGDSITTDHISPVGAIARESAAGRHLLAAGVERRDFNSYGTRRGNHEVMVRGTFGNIRLRNAMAPDHEGPWTVDQPSGELVGIYEASCRYRERGVPAVVLAGKDYGCGSSRDWAAKGTAMLGVRAVLAESFERIHRSNLVGMGVLPLQFDADRSSAEYGLTGAEEFHIAGVDGLRPGGRVTVRAVRPDGTELSFPMTARIDSRRELDYYRHGGVLAYVLRQLIKRSEEGK